MTTQELNSRLQVRKVSGLKFGNRLTHVVISGYALFIEGMGYVSIASQIVDSFGSIIKVPYQPDGGKKILNGILKSGLVTYSDGHVSFVNPI